MKLAFGTLNTTAWDPATTAAKAKELGFDGIEIPASTEMAYAGAGVPIACVTTPISFSEDPQAAAALTAAIELAKKLDCGLVKIRDARVPPRQSRSEVAAAMARWMQPLADLASERGVRIVVENALSFAPAREMWNLMEAIAHPAVGVCLDAWRAALAGDVPSISVPTLNSRIAYVQIKDGKPGEADPSKLGEGQIPIRQLLQRLAGIGYKGWVTLHWDKLSGEEYLPEAAKTLIAWVRPPAPTPVKPAKPAVKPKPVALVTPATPMAPVALVTPTAAAPVTPAPAKP